MNTQYPHDYAVDPLQQPIWDYLPTKGATFALFFIHALTNILWPVHVALNKMKNVKGIGKIKNHLLKLSPIVDYQDAYPSLGSKLLYQWAILDTHDALTDHYKHLRSADEISNTLQSCGMTDIQTAYAGNGVEARARKKTTQE